MKTMMLSKSFFRSVKPHQNPISKSSAISELPNSSFDPSKSPPPPAQASASSSSSSQCNSSSPSRSRSRSSKATKNQWSVYLILSTNHPIKTYVGCTNNFSLRLKQHNGELVGGAKASRAGRPWVCACLIHGFPNKSKACEFESRWKIISKKSPRKRKNKEVEESIVEDSSLRLLQHRNAALCKVKELIDCNHLEIEWHFDLS